MSNLWPIEDRVLWRFLLDHLDDQIGKSACRLDNLHAYHKSEKTIEKEAERLEEYKALRDELKQKMKDIEDCVLIRPDAMERANAIYFEATGRLPGGRN